MAAAMADDTADAAVANRIAKHQRWCAAIHESVKYKTVHAVIMAGKSLPETLPDTPRHEMANSKRHWESLCRQYRHCLQRLCDHINANAELKSIVDEATKAQRKSTGDSVLACLQS